MPGSSFAYESLLLTGRLTSLQPGPKCRLRQPPKLTDGCIPPMHRETHTMALMTAHCWQHSPTGEPHAYNTRQTYTLSADTLEVTVPDVVCLSRVCVHLEVSVQDGWAVCVQVQQALQDLEGPALHGHVTDVAQVLLAVPGGAHRGSGGSHPVG